MMLHHPWLTKEDLVAMKASPAEGLEPTYAHAYQRCQLNGCHHPRDPLDPLDGEENPNGEDDIDAMTEYEEDGHADEDLGAQQDFTVLAGRTGLHDASNVGEVETTLGKRDIDLTYDWHGSDHRYDEYGDQSNFYALAKTIEPNVDRILHDPDTLQGSQRTCFDLIMRQYELEVRGEGEPPRQLLLHIDSVAGTGKSYLIDTISAHLYQAARRGNRDDPVRRAAPTGVAAFNINGQTLHGMLRLPVRTAFSEDLPNSVLIHLQTIFRGCSFLLVDEKSMLGLRQLYWIDRRLRQIFPRRANEPFGGINVVLIGDFFQLPPVGERSLYDTKPPSNAPGQEYISAGQQLYRLFDRTIILDRVMRQQGEDERSVRFRDLLTGLREGTVAPDGFELLSSRVRSKLSVVERARFNGALRIYARKQ